MDRLKQYNKKRNLKESHEPQGTLKKESPQNKLIFIVQHHIASHDHYDFRLEWKSVLLSWAIPKGPSFSPEDKRLAVQVENHPLDYASFEGTIPQGQYGGGTVMLWDRGTWKPYKDKDVNKALKKGELKFELKGKRLNGKWALIKLKTVKNNEWLLIKEKDEYAKTDAGISSFDTSIKTGRTMKEITNAIKPKTKNTFKTSEKLLKEVNTKTNFNHISSEPPSNITKDLKKLITKNKNEIYVEKVKISNPDKLLFDKPKIKKIDVVLYYAYMAKYILPYINGRILSVIRCPNGINGEKFYKKHPSENSKNIRTVQVLSIDESNKNKNVYTNIEDKNNKNNNDEINGDEQNKNDTKQNENEKIIKENTSAEQQNKNKKSNGQEKHLGNKNQKYEKKENTLMNIKENINEYHSTNMYTEENKNTNYFYIDNAKGLISEAQMDTLEFHPWGSKYKTLEKPDIMVFDLDPSKNLSLKKLRQGVRDLKSILDKLGLISFLKTSGGKGYHIVVPFKPSTDWQTFRDFSKNIAITMETMYPDRYTSNMRMEKRKGKIFIDWERNIRGATAVAPYSIRIRPNAPVSMPIAWEELDNIKPNSITMKKALQKVAESNPWKDFFTINQKLK